MDINWKLTCDGLTDYIWASIKEIVGTEEAAIKIGDLDKYKKDTKKIDILAEDVVINYLKKEKMDISLLSEEIGEIQIGSKSKYKLILDPIDGSTNAIKGLPFFSTSIAIAKGNKIEDLIFGYVRNYLPHEIFYVNQNSAFFNDKKCGSFSCNSLNKALISFYSYGNVNYELIRKVIRKINKMRLFGAVSVELCYVGSNKLDGIIDLRGDLKITDIAAGILFVINSKGVVTDRIGNEISGKLELGEKYSIVAAGNRDIHNKFLKMINS